MHFTCEKVKAETLVHLLEQEGFYVSSQSACSSKKSEPSRVLLQMGRTPKQSVSGIRISLDEEHTSDDINNLVQAVRKSIDFLTSI
ncbi:Cysteine desulfurase [compost metagenome]